MEERKEIVIKMVSKGMPTSKALTIANIPRSTFYYKSNGKKKGKNPSGWTLHLGKVVSDEKVVEAIQSILGQDFIDYGYIRTTEALKNLGYKINKKKVYRIMKENNLLYPSRKATPKQTKEYVEYSSPLCYRPFEVIEVDIKYIYIAGEKRNAYLITMLDVYTRMALVWTFNFDMKANRVVNLLNQLYSQWLIPHGVDPFKLQVKLRTDNGSQFIAKLFIEHLNQAGIKNEYIRPATPQQNGHIEAFHKTVSELVNNKYVFYDFNQAFETLKKFFDAYNNKRIMKAILYKAPSKFFKLWQENRIETKLINKKIKHFLREKTPENQAISPTEYYCVHDKYIKQSNRLLTSY